MKPRVYEVDRGSSPNMIPASNIDEAIGIALTGEGAVDLEDSSYVSQIEATSLIDGLTHIWHLDQDGQVVAEEYKHRPEQTE